LEVSSDLEKENNNKRIARLKGQVCKILVGERTTAGLRSKLDSIDDCIKSCISGLKFGVVQGGGYFLYNFVKNKKLKRIVKSYYSCILKNAGKKADGKFHNLNNYNIIDSAGVVASSLNNAWAGAREILYSKDLINITNSGI
jgi:chaperonin GroEL (HSP60 family)